MKVKDLIKILEDFSEDYNATVGTHLDTIYRTAQEIEDYVVNDDRVKEVILILK